MKTSDLTSAELYKLFEAKLKEEKAAEIAKDNKDLLAMQQFLQGKRFLKETCLNPNIIFYYECDPTYKVQLIENKWCNIENISSYRVTAPISIDVEDGHTDLAISHEFKNELTPHYLRRGTKSFHFNNIENISEISEEEFNTIKESYDKVSTILKDLYR